MTQIELLARETMLRVSATRAVFHSEADFQHEFAWQLRADTRVQHVRLERPFRVEGVRYKVDVLANVQGAWFGFELKYWPRTANVSIAGEEFALRRPPNDICRHDLWKDVTRMERLVDAKFLTAGCALALTNDWLFWDECRGSKPIDKQFHCPEGRVVRSGDELRWEQHAAPGSSNGRTKPLRVTGQYEVRWSPFGLTPAGAVPAFRYLLLVASPNKVGP